MFYQVCRNICFKWTDYCALTEFAPFHSSGSRTCVFALFFFKNWISSLLPSLDKFFLISFNILLSSPNTFFIFFFFSIFVYDPRSDTKELSFGFRCFLVYTRRARWASAIDKTCYNKSFPDKFRLARCFMELGSIACPHWQLSIETVLFRN